MCTYKNILIFLTIVASTYAYPYPEEDYPTNSNIENKNESHELTPEEVKQSYYEYYKDIKNHNYFDISQLPGEKTQAMIEQTHSAVTYPIAYQLRNMQAPRFYGSFTPPNIEGLGDNTGLSSNNKYFYDSNLQPNRHLRSAQNKEEFNINSLDTVVNNNVRDENYRERVKNIREHFKKYMEHYINGEKNAATRHNFEPYYPRQNNNNNNMIVLKVQDENDALTAGRDSLGHMNKDDALKFLHIIEGNELLQNSEDTDYRFQIAFGDT